jgi:heat-inducible transcriptional repressor
MALLSERQKLILGIIIDDYIQSAEPVGSRTISKRGDVGYSPATIRNEMSDLEELGFLEQPHTSSGRIPSHKGYRYYVDHLVRVSQLLPTEMENMKFYFNDKIQETEHVFQQVAMILSNLTSYTAIALGPELFQANLKHLQLIPLNEQTAVAIIVTNTGHVENKTVSIPPNLSMSEIEKFVNIFNHKLSGIPLHQLKSKLYNELGQELSRYISQYEELIRMIETVVSQDPEAENRIYKSGAINILNQPEFKDIDKVKTIFELLDEAPALAKLFAKAPNGIQVKIGAENAVEAIQNCSLITATYSVEGQSIGTIGILGPTRMEYGKVISLLDYLSKDMAIILSRWYR